MQYRGTDVVSGTISTLQIDTDGLKTTNLPSSHTFSGVTIVALFKVPEERMVVGTRCVLYGDVKSHYDTGSDHVTTTRSTSCTADPVTY